MMKKYIILMILTILLVPSMAFAAPGIPNQIWGTVTYNGLSAADGLTVTGKINGVEVVSSTTSDGMYSVIVTDPDNTRDSDDIIHLFVNGIDTGKSSAFCNGCITEINLAVTYTSPPPTDDGGTSTTGGGSFIPLTTTDEKNETEEDSTTTQDESEDKGCVEAWVCSSWSNCEDGIQTRECFDKKDCGTEDNMPFESQPCSLIEEQTKKSNQQSDWWKSLPTGFASLTSISSPVKVSIIGILLMAIFIGFYLKKKK